MVGAGGSCGSGVTGAFVGVVGWRRRGMGGFRTIARGMSWNDGAAASDESRRVGRLARSSFTAASFEGVVVCGPVGMDCAKVPRNATSTLPN